MADQSDKQHVIVVKASGRQILSKQLDIIANLHVPHTDKTCLALIVIKQIGRQENECRCDKQVKHNAPWLVSGLASNDISSPTYDVGMRTCSSDMHEQQGCLQAQGLREHVCTAYIWTGTSGWRHIGQVGHDRDSC